MPPMMPICSDRSSAAYTVLRCTFSSLATCATETVGKSVVSFADLLQICQAWLPLF